MALAASGLLGLATLGAHGLGIAGVIYMIADEFSWRGTQLFLLVIISALLPLCIFYYRLIKSTTRKGVNKYTILCFLVTVLVMILAYFMPSIYWLITTRHDGWWALALVAYTFILGFVLTLGVVTVRLLVYWHARGELVFNRQQLAKVIVGLLIIAAVLLFYVGSFMLFRWAEIAMGWFAFFFIVTFFILWQWYIGWRILRE